MTGSMWKIGWLTVIAGVFLALYPFEAKAASINQGDMFGTADGRQMIEVNTADELKITRDGEKVLARYGLDGDGMRVVYNDADTVVVDFYTVTSEGLKDKSGAILYAKVGSSAMRRMEQEALEDIMKSPSIRIAGGCFEMGDTTGKGGSDEKPVHRVCLDDFSLDKYQVTQAAFSDVMGANPSSFKACPNCPVDSITWFEAKLYCKKIGKRLPTETEFEYAAREGGKEIAFATGLDFITRSDANYSSAETVRVGSYPANELGLHDLSGNVWEWTADWYDADYYGKSPENNPQGPWTGETRVLRGGSYNVNPQFLRVSNRSNGNPAARCHQAGFRCAQ